MLDPEYSIQIYEGMEVIFEERTPYMSQAQMASMLNISRDAVSDALRSAHERGFIDLDATTRKFTVVAPDGKRRVVNHYSGKAILLVGFRVQQATPNVIAFQDWITSIWENHLQVEREKNEQLQIALSHEQREKEAAEWEAETAKRELNDRLLVGLSMRYPEEFDNE